MIRAGAQAPQPPPLPSSPGTAKPRHTRDSEKYKERILQSLRHSGNLRDKIVQLASRKENKSCNEETAAGIRSANGSPRDSKFSTALGDDARETRDVTFVVLDLRTGRASSKVISAAGDGSPSSQTAKTSLSGRRVWEKVAGTGCKSKAERNLLIDSYVGRTPRSAEPRRPLVDPSNFPRLSARRFRSPVADPSSIHNAHQPSNIHTSSPMTSDNAHLQQSPEESLKLQKAEEQLKNNQSILSEHTTHGKTAATAAVTSATNTATKISPRGLKTSSRCLTNRQIPDVQNSPSSCTTSPRSQDTVNRSSQGTPRQNCTSKVVVESKLTEPIDCQSSTYCNPRQGLNYRKAGRVVYVNRTPVATSTEPQKRVRSCVGQDRHKLHLSKNVSFRGDDSPSYLHQSSGSSGDSPRQVAKGAGEAGEVGEVRGNALPSSPHPRLHTPHSPSRPNASSFASSLEMFKRRLKMNHHRPAAKGWGPEEEDYVIRLGDTVPSSATLKISQPISNPQPRHNHNHNQQQQQQEQQKPTLQSPRRRPQIDVDPTDKLYDHHFHHHQHHHHDEVRLNTGHHKDHHPDQSEDGVTMDVDQPLGAGGGGCEGSLGEEDAFDDKDCSASCRMLGSADSLTYVPIGEVDRTPLPRVKTYVVEGDVTKLFQDRPQGPILALTRHNVNMHDTFLQRRGERQGKILRRAELERVAGVGGGGHLDPQDCHRMQRWLVDTEHYQRELQPLVNFKIAVPPVY